MNAFFKKTNRDPVYKEPGIEWATAQLGHFWIECRILKNQKTMQEVVLNDDEIREDSDESVSIQERDSKQEESVRMDRPEEPDPPEENLDDMLLDKSND